MLTLNSTSPGSKFANGKRQWTGKYYNGFKIRDNIHGISSELRRSHSEEDGGDKILEPICGLFGFGQASAHPQINQPLSVGETEMLYQYAVSWITTSPHHNLMLIWYWHAIWNCDTRRSSRVFWATSLFGFCAKSGIQIWSDLVEIRSQIRPKFAQICLLCITLLVVLINIILLDFVFDKSDNFYVIEPHKFSKMRIISAITYNLVEVLRIIAGGFPDVIL